MAAYGDRVQALMDEVYSEWQKEENKGKSKWDVLGGFSEAHQIAVVLGNFNYQVGNGGISQWIYNGYFQDDAEKLTEYLEIGAESDERCRTILDKVYKLDSYAQDTECDRGGYFTDEDGESGFIGDMINCDAFDSWYYDKCDDDNWWQVVCGIIDKVEGRESALGQQDERGGGDAVIQSDREWTIKAEYVYQGDGGKRLSETVYYPADEETITRLSENAGINGVNERVFYSETMESVIPGLENILPDSVGFDELNNLAIKIRDMDAQGRGKFAAAIKNKGQYGSVGEIINLSNHLDNPAAYLPLRVYIENIHDDSIGGFTMPLPTTSELLRPFLEKTEITGWQDMKIWEALSDIGDLGDVVSEGISKTMSPNTLDELNYLAAKIQALPSNEFEVFAAALEAKRHCGSVAEIINLTENLDRFHIQPAHTPGIYGEFLLDMQKDETAEIFRKLEQSENPDARAFAQYILKLEAHVDEDAYGRAAAAEENGVFTDHGYITESEGFKTVYHGAQDIPAEYRLFSQQSEIVKPLMKVENTDIAAAVVKICAVSGDYMAHGTAAEMLKEITAGQDRDYLLTVNTNGIHFYPAMDAYKRGDGSAGIFTSLTGEPGTRFFALSVNAESRGITGDVVELNRDAFRANAARHCISPDRIDATMTDGFKHSYDLWSWADLPIPYRSQIAGYEAHYSEGDIKNAYRRFDNFRSTCADECKAVSEAMLLVDINSAYMAAAAQPQPDMIRVANEAAKEILASGAAGVYRLTTSGAEKLAPIEAARPMCFSEHRELAIKCEDSMGLETWAKRTADKIIRQNERGEREKAKNKGEEL